MTETEDDARTAASSGAVSNADGAVVAERRRTRIALVIDSHWEALMGGAQYQARCLLELLRPRRDVEILFVTRNAPENRERDGYRIVTFGSSGNQGRLRMLLDLPSLVRTLRELEPDVVYQRCLMPFTGACAWYCRGHGAKLVYHVASDRDVEKAVPFEWSRYGLLKWVARRVGLYGMRRADAIVAQTEQQARMLKSAHGLDATLVVRNFQPIPDLCRSAEEPARVRVVWIANFKPLKRPEVFVDLAEALSHRDDVEFVMIGRPGPRARFGALHERIARLSNLRYLGELPIEQVERELEASDLLVNTSLWEGFPNTFIQAWLRGVPVVSCFVDPDGCLSRGGAGVFVGSDERLVDAVASLLHDRTRLRELGRAARAYAVRHHSPESALPLVELLTAPERLRKNALEPVLANRVGAKVR